ncbi:HpcH/HpaI aldolase/citrate lyase family protein [Sphingomonas corticis]|uniref:CoA ester lyase n=1 Tax=Sphingomonas corticis TaxID=2722791 RepID=A0ABX1CUG9_9SPHN|nr:CoA ester lyase [Sphingomonas corticis]NJR79610.1 CoA ester lyase [Sphingomonas corticis]
MTHRPRRSALFLPASNARAIEKARALDADVVILDLEDAVAPDQKATAREAAVAAVRSGGFGHRELVVRANAIGTAEAEADLAALAGSGAAAVLLPKVDDPQALHRARAVLGKGPALWAMIETPRAILDLPVIVAAAAATGLAALIAGTNDLAKELRCRPFPDRAPLVPVLVQIVVAARAAGLVALDGVSNVLDDPAAVEAECRQGRALGYDGKTLIHPSQVAPANAVFGPDEEEVRWARAVARAFDGAEAEDKGAIRVEGKMVERLHLEEARRTLAIHEAVTTRS